MYSECLACSFEPWVCGHTATASTRLVACPRSHVKHSLSRMCRLLAYYGEDALLSHTIIHPERSIIKQSYDARERLQDDSLPAHLGFGNLNADGFGIGFYSTSTERCPPGCRPATELESRPCTFKSITPGQSLHALTISRSFMHIGLYTEPVCVTGRAVCCS